MNKLVNTIETYHTPEQRIQRPLLEFGLFPPRRLLPPGNMTKLCENFKTLSCENLLEMSKICVQKLFQNKIKKIHQKVPGGGGWAGR